VDAGFAAWLVDAEATFRDVLRATDRTPGGTVVKYLNTQGKLGDQQPLGAPVVWGNGGTYVRAAVIPADIGEVHGVPVRGFVIDLNQYVVVCGSDDDAHYLCAMLNSDACARGSSRCRRAASSALATSIAARSKSCRFRASIGRTRITSPSQRSAPRPTSAPP
jgi:hypothetical protein